MLSVRGIKKTFNANTVNEKIAVRNLHLHLNPGDYVTVIGGNGSGKSTLLDCIAGVQSIDAGSILIDRQDVSKIPEHRRAKFLGRVFQDPMVGTSAQMSIEENLALAYRRGKRRRLNRGINAKERILFQEALKKLGLGLEDRLQTPVGFLSGGQRQALTLLMATLKNPKVLLLDEHTAALDPKTAPKVLEITDEVVRENGLTTLMVTHNIKDALQFGNRLIMMHSGSLVLDLKGEDKRKLTVDDILNRFNLIGGEESFPEQALLA